MKTWITDWMFLCTVTRSDGRFSDIFFFMKVVTDPIAGGELCSGCIDGAIDTAMAIEVDTCMNIGAELKLLVVLLGVFEC